VVESLDAAFHREARLIRRVSGSTKLETAMRKAVKILADNGIPHLIADGMAITERGYPRTTKDVDIIVPDIYIAHDTLIKAGFKQSKKKRTDVVDPKSEVLINLLAGGEKVLDQGLPLPQPTVVSDKPQIASLDNLIHMKLSAGRSQDFADVVALIKANSLPKDYRVHRMVKVDYLEAWDTASVEQATEDLLGGS